MWNIILWLNNTLKYVIILEGPWRTQYSEFYHIALLHYSWHEASMYNKLMSFQPLGIT